mmetsp:Transcript_14190/g.37729  ORF Transcript_14190/g.37729 Transcript_14190/m.37729 type:complete len:116 (+) Transcript_14190:94-441(+)
MLVPQPSQLFAGHAAAEARQLQQQHLQQLLQCKCLYSFLLVAAAVAVGGDYSACDKLSLGASSCTVVVAFSFRSAFVELVNAAGVVIMARYICIWEFSILGCCARSLWQHPTSRD